MVTNAANGVDPVENYDVVGGLTSALASPVVANLADGAIDATLAGGIQINSLEKTTVNTVVGSGLGKSLGNAVSAIKKNTSEMVGAVSNFISGLFSNSAKSISTEVVNQEEQRK